MKNFQKNYRKLFSQKKLQIILVMSVKEIRCQKRRYQKLPNMLAEF